MSTHDDLREIALGEFALAGYAGTSLQRIAEIAGLSKSSVLYHYASKDALLEAAVAPAIEQLSRILEILSTRPATVASRNEFIAEFVDFLLDHRLEVHLFINQGPSLVDVPVVDRANELVQHLAEFFASAAPATEHRMRFGVALGGAAYMLVTQHAMGLESAPRDETRTALITILGELLAPVPVPIPAPSVLAQPIPAQPVPAHQE